MDFSYLDSWMEEETPEGAVEETGEGYRNIWVFSESFQGQIHPNALEALGQARELAGQIGVYVYGILLGETQPGTADELIAYGADKVLIASDPQEPERLVDYQPEVYVRTLAALVERFRPEILLMPATCLGSDLAPRLAQKLDTGLISRCVKLEVDMSQRLLLGSCPVMGGEVYHTFDCPTARPQMATLEPGYFRAPYKDDYRSGEVRQVDVDLSEAAAELVWTGVQESLPAIPVPLCKQRVVVSAGRGMEDQDGFALVERLAEALGGVAAGSRGAFEMGWIPEERIVGVGGELIAPDLYVACGLSGDIHHYFGVQDAKFIVAINPDEQAPIMKAANLAVVGDARQVIPELLKALSL